MKTCIKCGLTKALDAFSPAWSQMRPGMLRADCKSCNSKRVVARELLNPQRKRDRANAWRRSVKDAVFGAYGGYRCACCGETDWRFLQLDHINNDGGKWRKLIIGSAQTAGYANASTRTYRWIIKNNFPPGLQVLCANCNFGKRMNGGICPHQQGATTRPIEAVESSDSKRTPSVLVH